MKMTKELFENAETSTVNMYKLTTEAPTLSYKIGSGEIGLPWTDIMQEFMNFRIVNDYQKSNFILFDSLNYVDKYMLDLIPPGTLGSKWINGLNGTDELAGKGSLAKYMVTSQFIPKSFGINNGKNTFQDFKNKFYEHGKIYIFKKNIQRQQGIKISNDLNEIQSFFSDPEFVICQELLQDPAIVDGRKINLRIYMLVVVRGDGKTEIHIYNNGFIYYTVNPWAPNSVSLGSNITTGYIDRQVYVDNPLTVQELISSGKTSLTFDSIKKTCTELAGVYAPIFTKANKGIFGDATKFQIFGCDIAPSADNKCYIMEVNKGPDLSYKDARDRALKLGMIKDMLKVIKALPQSSGEKNGFIKVI